MGKFLLIFILIISCTYSSAQVAADKYNYIFDRYTTQDGLGDNVVLKSIKDKYGYLWVATRNGISRFDGLVFKNYTHNINDPNSLRSIWTCDLILDSSKTLWASTEWGVCYFNEKTDHFQYINDRKEIQVLYHAPFFMSDKSTLWVAAEDGLKKINTATKKYSSTSLDRISDPQFIISDKKENLLIGTTQNGIFKYDIKNNTYSALKIPAGIFCIDVLSDDEGIWVATDVGLMLVDKNEKCSVFSKGNKALEGIKIEQLTCVEKFYKATGSDYIICGTNTKKLFLFDKKNKVFMHEWRSTPANPDGFSAAVVNNLMNDDNMLWIGTDRGLSRVNLNMQKAHHYEIEPILKKNDIALVKKIIHSNSVTNEIWAIPWQPYYGVLLYDIQQQEIIREWNSASTKNPQKYNDIILLKNKNLAAAREGFVDIFSKEKGLIKSIPVKNVPFSTCVDENDNIWVGSDVGLAHVDVKTSTTKYYVSDFIGTDIEKKSFKESFLVSGIKKSGDKLWLTSTKYGLFSFDIKSKKFTPYRQPFNNTFSTLNRCSSVELIGSDSVWVGTMEGLTCFIPSKNKFINYNSASGLNSAYVYAIVKDEYNNIWGRGNADLFVFNSATQKVNSIKLKPQYNIKYYEQEFSVYQDKILIGHEGGFSDFSISNNSSNEKNIPILEINDLKVNNVDIPEEKSFTDEPLNLQRNQNQLTFSYNAIEFNQSDEIEYWYKTEGLDAEFKSGGTNRTVSYNNLSHGSYRFCVFAINKNNTLKSEIKSIRFTIKPSLWEQWWFWPLMAFIFIASVIIIARSRIAGIRKTEELKTASNKKLAELETMMLRSQMNPHFIFNSLNSIQKYIWENKEEDAAEYLASFAKLMRAILENSTKESILLKTEIDITKLYVDLEHRRSNAGFDYRIKIDESLDQLNVLIPPLIMQPFIENAIWHGLNKMKEKGFLSILITERDNYLVCIIDDNGVGRNAKNDEQIEEHKSMGISITEQRIEKLMRATNQKGAVEIEDKFMNDKPAGTKITLTLPMQKNETT